MIEKNLFPTGPLRPETVESLHRTSIASSLDENRLDEVKEEIAASPDKRYKMYNIIRLCGEFCRASIAKYRIISN